MLASNYAALQQAPHDNNLLTIYRHPATTATAKATVRVGEVYVPTLRGETAKDGAPGPLCLIWRVSKAKAKGKDRGNGAFFTKTHDDGGLREEFTMDRLKGKRALITGGTTGIRAVVYLASDESAFMVGAEMLIDGGMAL
jgi:hypothetical protein